jgi:hypothetical protein
MLQGAGAVLALCISIVAVSYVMQQANIQREDYQFRLKQVEGDAKEKDKLIAAERLRFQHAQTSRFIDDMNEFDMLYTTFPYITDYHEKVFSDDPAEDNAPRCKRLRTKFLTEPGDKKRIILTSCEMLANFMDATILQRESLDPGDWNRWWNSFMDNYDENPILQDFLEMRPDWYKAREALSNKKKRMEYYREGESKRSPDSACFK